jgi:hypothetical protein
MFSVGRKLDFYLLLKSYCAFCEVWTESLGDTSDWWWVLEGVLLKIRSKSSIQWSGYFSMNRGFQGKHLYAGVNVCILSVFHEVSWLLHWMLWSRLHIHCVFLGFITIQSCDWVLILHRYLVLPTEVCLCQLAHHLSCQSCTPNIEVSISIRSSVTPVRPSRWIPKRSQVLCTCTVTLFYLTTIICHFLPLVHFACVWLAVHTEVFCFLPQSAQANACTAPQIRPLQSSSTSFPVYY